MLTKTKIELKEILSPILPYLKEVNRSIDAFLTNDLKVLDHGAKHVFKNPGKQIRAAFVLLGASYGMENKHLKQTLKKADNITNAVGLAVGVELVHAATLIHDDIIDQAKMRRGQPTIGNKWNNKVAVLVGDWMFTRGLDIAAQEKHSMILPILIAATRAMVKGELAQIEYSSIDTINYDRYIAIIGAKTAKFLAACIQVGSLNQDLHIDVSSLLYDFAYNCGLGFQIIDDLMDFSEQKQTGKDCANDFLDGKPTLPIIYLLEQPGSVNKEVKKLYRDPCLASFTKLKQIVQEQQTLEKSYATAKEYVDRGLASLDKLESTKTIAILKQLSHFFLERNS